MPPEHNAANAEMVVWSVVRGESPGVQAVEPGWAGVGIPDDVLDWGERHGLQDDDPDVYLLVAPGDEAEPEVLGEVARRRGPLPASDVARVREAVVERSGR
ncbi:hypothetical protein ABZ864_47780 [Streptomyces sp. NPDC047082]|uniref:hypothetical protein n=1 Tax=Streptomyces sp. NPDC047082 TaxID=3155259 RepID=UPI0033EA669A